MKRTIVNWNIPIKPGTTIVKFGTKFSLPAGWIDSSDDAGNADCLLTLTKPDGVGALQMSFAQYVSGKLPNIALDDLRELMSEFARRRQLGPQHESDVGGHDGMVWCRADYRWEADFIRVWYISDSQSVILATYICCWADRNLEVSDCDRIVDSVRFSDP